MTRATKPDTSLDVLRAGRSLEHLISTLLDDPEHCAGQVVGRLLQRLLDQPQTSLGDLLLETAQDYQASLRQAEEHRLAFAAARARAAQTKAQQDELARAVVATHPCPRCDAPAGQPCISVGPSRQPKKLEDLHAARLAIAREAK